ncbi:MAG: FMN-binding protein [Erysipelotrichaceae bacterium]
MKKILHLTMFLALISALAGGALAAVNTVTSPIIEENKIAVEKQSLSELYPGATFAAEEFSGADKAILGIFSVSGSADATVYKMEIMGYKNTITFLVGLDSAGSISGYKVLDHEETSGIGSKVAEESWTNSLVGQPVNTPFDTIGGATVSSKAILTALDIAASHWSENYGTLGEPGAPVEKEYGTLENTVDNGDGTTTYTVWVEGFYPDGNTIDITVDADAVITAFKVTKNNDTPEYGGQISKESFTSQFVGQSVSMDLEVDVISGSTISSTSAMNAVKVVAKALAE